MALLLVVFVAGCGLREKVPPPRLSSISPNTGAQGQTVVVTLTGTDFVWDPTVNVGGAQITVSDAGVESGGTRITATFAIAENALPGPVNVSVTCWGITTQQVTFTIVPGEQRRR
jgi:hypothetical protein